MTYNSNGSKIHAWVRTRSGAVISMVLPDAKFSFNGTWKEVDLTTVQLNLITKQRRLMELTTENPNEQTQKTPKVSLQGIKVSKNELTMVVGDETSVQLTYIPSDVDTTNLKAEVLSDKVKIASCSIKNSDISILAHNEGTTNIRATVGTMIAVTKVTVVKAPRFVQSEYTGEVNKEITLQTSCPVGDVSLTVPENVSVVEGTVVTATKSGTYEIIASAYGRTFTTKLVVSEPTETEESLDNENEVSETTTE